MNSNLVWCIDTETQDQILIDTSTWRIVATKDKNGTIKEVSWEGLDENRGD